MSKENALATVQQLRGPSVSGSVTVPLAELDQMRSDHAAAVRAARELADKQAMIKIVVAHVAEGGRQRNILVEDDNLMEVSIMYKNLDDVRDALAKDARERVQDHIDSIGKQLEGLTSQVAESSNKLSETIAAFAEEKKLHQGLQKRYNDLETKFNTTNLKFESAVQTLTEERKLHEEALANLKEASEAQNKIAEATIIDLQNKLKDCQEGRPWWKKLL
jgi:chromosome segregation ATPase